MVLFRRSFGEIWHFAPFRPAARLPRFVAKFMHNEGFDAEGFWEHVVARQKQIEDEKASAGGTVSEPGATLSRPSVQAVGA
jgi:hypothetical protein